MNRLYELRKQHGFTRVELAQMIRVTEVTLFNWEKGKHRPRKIYLEKLSEIFNVPVSFFTSKP